MEKKEVKALAVAYCENPRAWRKSEEGQKALSKLSPAVQTEVKSMLEARRGFRRVNGVIEFDKKALVSEIARLKSKRADMKARLPLIDARVKELEEQLAERFGEDNK